MKKFLAFLFAIMFATPVFATVINNNSATCDGNTLGVTSGSVRLRAKYAPETINLKWYDSDGNTTTTNTCTYDGGLTLPTQPTKSGYTFKGWRVINYTPIEYIESTGTQYIDTGYVLTGDEILEFEAQFTGATQSSNYDSFFTGCQYSNAAKGGFWVDKYVRASGEWQWYVRYNSLASVSTTNVTAGLNQRNKLSIGSGSFKVDGVEVLHPTDAGTYQDTPITIFGRKSLDGSMAGRAWKCWSYKIIKNNNVVKSYIPAKRNSDGVVGMYDTVSGTFFTNAGTGDFIAGPDL